MNFARAVCFFLGLLLLSALPVSSQKPPDPSHFSVVGVTIGQDNLATLQSKLGPVKKCRTKEHDGVDIAGYTDSTNDVVFEFGEVGGGEVTGFYLTRPHRSLGCSFAHLPSTISELTTTGGIHLGMAKEEFVRIFGPPKSRIGNLWKYDWTLETKYTDEERKKAASEGYSVSDSYLIGITIEATFSSGGALRYFYVSKLEVT